MSFASSCLSVLSPSLTAHCDCSAPWLRRFRPAAALTALLCLSAVYTPATAQVTQLPVWKEQNPTASLAARVPLRCAVGAGTRS